MSLSSTIDLLGMEAFIMGIVWVFYSAGKPVLAGIVFVTFHLIAHNGHIGVTDKDGGSGVPRPPYDPPDFPGDPSHRCNDRERREGR